VLDILYGRIALARRAWYERPGAQRQLARPVISVGNLSVGGTGKTPLVAALAAWLVERGERPAVLSRGYARRVLSPRPVVVSDGTRVLADVATAGDEPLMLARALPGVAVVVAANRYTAGLVAAHCCSATVHLLDDGFQHLALARDLDIVVTPAGELATGAVLPKGRLREPLAALSRAALLVVVGAADEAAAAAEAQAVGVPLGVLARRRLGPPIALGGEPPPPRARLVVMAGIGRPNQFVESLHAADWRIADVCAFPDHHWYSARELATVADRVAATGAWGVATTDKDAVRLETLGPLPVAVARWPLSLDVPRWDVVAEAVTAAMAGRA
jgi:tetraacyldisaccharide 4'-kinase